MVRSLSRITLTVIVTLFSIASLRAQDDVRFARSHGLEPGVAEQERAPAAKTAGSDLFESEASKRPSGETLDEPALDGTFTDRITKAPATERALQFSNDEGPEFRPEFDLKTWRKNWNETARFGEPRHGPVKDTTDAADDPPAAAMPQRFHWKPAIYQSLLAQGFQHAYALVIQEKTQRALKGPFLSDYWESIKGVRGWDDGNKFFTNYIAHPMQGAMTGFIFLQNHDRLRRQTFNESPQYWKDRFKAFVWSAAWSTNWEIGPISQASIGNVGLYGHGGWVDFVITPTVGTGWMITEEAMDRYIIRHWEEKNLATRIVLRTFLNPMRSVANILRFKKPWYRDRAN